MNEHDPAIPEARGRPGRKPSGQVIARTTKNGQVLASRSD